MSDAMACATAGAMLPALLDGELSGPDRTAIEAHLAGCPACRAEADRGTAESRRLRNLAGTYRAPGDLRERIGATLDAADRSAAPARAPRPRFRRALAAAAAIVLLLAGAAIGVFVAREPAEQRITAEIMASHLRALIADRLVDVASSDQHTVKPWFNGRVDVAPPVVDMTEQGYRLAGGRIDYIGDRRVAVLVYRHRQHAIDLYVWPAGVESAAPAAMARRGYNLSTWSAHGLTFWAITDLNAPDLDRFVELARARFGRPDAR